jgi:hypothetical protein
MAGQRAGSPASKVVEQVGAAHGGHRAVAGKECPLICLTMMVSLPRHPSSVARARSMLATLLGLSEATKEHRGHLPILITEACAFATPHIGGRAPGSGAVTYSNHCSDERPAQPPRTTPRFARPVAGD